MGFLTAVLRSTLRTTTLPLAVGSALALGAGGAVAATPQGYALLQTAAADPFNFGGAVVAGPNGVLYGTVGDTLYALTPPAGAGAWSLTVIGRAWTTGGGTVADGYSFSGGKVAVDATGAVYAATSLRLEGGGGVVRFTPPANAQTAWTKTVLWSLVPGTDGAAVNGGLILGTDGAVYGALLGGAQRACYPGCQFGSVFRLAPPAHGQTAWTVQVLHHFTGGNDGEAPDGTLFMNAAGLLFGTAGAGPNGLGIVFRLQKTGSGWVKTTLYAFAGGTDGSDPVGGVVQDSADALYGVTAGCASATPCNKVGTVYRLKTTAIGGANFATLAGPAAFPAYQGNLLVDRAGIVYGATRYPCTSTGVACGQVFSLTPPATGKAWTYTPLADLGQDGGPQGLAVANGVLYGTADQGAGCATARGGCTTVFAVSGTGFAP